MIVETVEIFQKIKRVRYVHTEEAA